MSVSGTILACNREPSTLSDLLNNDPYGKGWLVKACLANPSELDSLVDSSQYESLIKSVVGEE